MRHAAGRRPGKWPVARGSTAAAEAWSRSRLTAHGSTARRGDQNPKGGGPSAPALYARYPWAWTVGWVALAAGRALRPSQVVRRSRSVCLSVCPRLCSPGRWWPSFSFSPVPPLTARVSRLFACSFFPQCSWRVPCLHVCRLPTAGGVPFRGGRCLLLRQAVLCACVCVLRLRTATMDDGVEVTERTASYCHRHRHASLQVRVCMPRMPPVGHPIGRRLENGNQCCLRVADSTRAT